MKSLRERLSEFLGRAVHPPTQAPDQMTAPQPLQALDRRALDHVKEAAEQRLQDSIDHLVRVLVARPDAELQEALARIPVAWVRRRVKKRVQAARSVSQLTPVLAEPEEPTAETPWAV